MSCEVLNETDVKIDLESFVLIYKYVLKELGSNPGLEVCLKFIGDDEMEQLHIEWLGLEGSTDVMSFPMDQLVPGDPETEGILGDIVISPTFAAAQAKAAGHSAHDEMSLLFIHGLLHLFGFDHEEPAERAEMFSLQRKLLLGFLIWENPVQSKADLEERMSGMPDKDYVPTELTLSSPRHPAVLREVAVIAGSREYGEIV